MQKRKAPVLVILLVTALVCLLSAGELHADIAVLNPTDDTFIDEWAPNTNHGGEQHFVVRRGGTGFQLNGLIMFDLGSLPQSITVSSATLYCYHSHFNDGDPAGRPLDLHRVTSSWGEGTVTWNTQPTYSSTSAATSNVPGSTGTWMSWDVTSEVQSIVGAGSYDGWEIIDHASGGSFSMIYFRSKEFSGYEPYLEIEYTGGLAAPQWEGPVQISQGSEGWYYPQIAVQDEHIHAVWRNAAANKLVYRRSTDNGNTWDTEQLLSGNTTFEPHIAVRDQYVHIVWRQAGGNILYKRSTNYGDSFESTVTLAMAPNNGYDVDVASAGDYVYVVWIKSDPTDVLFKRSTNNGFLWGTIDNITTDANTNVEQCSRVAASADHAYVTWWYNGASAMYCLMTRSTDYGVTWQPNQNIFQESLGAFSYISISAQDASVYVERDAHESTPIKGPEQRKSSDWGNLFASPEYLGMGNIEGPEVHATFYYGGYGSSVYIRDNELLVSTGYRCCEEVLDIISGSSASADIGASELSHQHVVASSNNPPYHIYYYRYLGVGDCDSISVEAIEDTWVNDNYPNSNYGALSYTYVGDQNGNEPPHTCRSYLKFDLAAVPTGVNVVEAKVWARSTNTGGNGIEVQAHHQQDDSWDEMTLTWNNQPAFSGSATDSRHADHSWDCWVVTSDVQSSLNGDGTYSVVLRGANEPDQYNWIGPQSSEGDPPPYLMIYYTTGGVCDCMPGDADGTGVHSIGDAVYIINFIFGGGPAPTPYAVCSGDADCSCNVAISDAVYIINFIFGGGPAPCTCEEWLSACGPPII